MPEACVLGVYLERAAIVGGGFSCTAEADERKAAHLVGRGHEGVVVDGTCEVGLGSGEVVEVELCQAAEEVGGGEVA